MSGSAPRLVYAYGLPEEREFPLYSATATIGRESINEIVFDDAEISRRHVRVTHLAGRFIIEDLGRTNGTFLNGRRIEAPAPLANGDVLDLGGSIRLTYLGPPGAAEATVVEPSVEQLGIPATAVRPTPVDEMPPDVMTGPHYDAPLTPPPIAPTFQSAVPQTLPQKPSPSSSTQSEGRAWSRYLIGSGCLVILAVLSCAVTLILLDSLAPNALYCGPLQSIFEAVGFSLSCV